MLLANTQGWPERMRASEAAVRRSRSCGMATRVSDDINVRLNGATRWSLCRAAGSQVRAAPLRLPRRVEKPIINSKQRNQNNMADLKNVVIHTDGGSEG